MGGIDEDDESDAGSIKKEIKSLIKVFRWFGASWGKNIGDGKSDSQYENEFCVKCRQSESEGIAESTNCQSTEQFTNYFIAYFPILRFLNFWTFAIWFSLRTEVGSLSVRVLPLLLANKSMIKWRWATKNDGRWSASAFDGRLEFCIDDCSTKSLISSWSIVVLRRLSKWTGERYVVSFRSLVVTTIETSPDWSFIVVSAQQK